MATLNPLTTTSSAATSSIDFRRWRGGAPRRLVAEVGGLPTAPPLGVKGAPQAPHPLRGQPSAPLDPEPLAARQPTGGAGTACPANGHPNREDSKR